MTNKKKLYKIFYSTKPNLQIPIQWEGKKITSDGYEVPVNKRAFLEVCKYRNYSKKELRRFVNRNIADIDGIERQVVYLLPIKPSLLRYGNVKAFEAPKAVKAFLEAVHLQTDQDDQFIEGIHLDETCLKTNYSNILVQIVDHPNEYTFDVDEILGESVDDVIDTNPQPDQEDGVRRKIGKKIGVKPVSKRKIQDQMLRKSGKSRISVPATAKNPVGRIKDEEELEQEEEGELI